MKVVHCPNCANEFKHDIAIVRTLGVGLGLLAAKQGAGQAVVVGATSFVLGHMIDAILVEYVDPTCPACGLVIREAANIIAHNSQ